jgi:hypothetical protein
LITVELCAIKELVKDHNLYSPEQKEKEEKEEQKLHYKALAIMVKNYLSVCSASELPMRSLADCIADNSAITSLANHLAEPSVIASSSSVTLDDTPPQVVPPLPYDDPIIPTRDIPMEDSMEVLEIT